MRCMIGGMAFLALLATVPTAGAAASQAQEQRVSIRVTNKGFEPSTVKVEVGRPVVMVVTRTTEKTCAKEIVIQERKIHQALPLDRAVEIRFTPRKRGTLRYACGMDMIAGTLVVR